jgi:hypothetical protein
MTAAARAATASTCPMAASESSVAMSFSKAQFRQPQHHPLRRRKRCLCRLQPAHRGQRRGQRHVKFGRAPAVQ